MKNSEIINNVIVAVTPFIQSIVDVFIKPKLEALRDKDKNKKLPVEKDFTEYLNRKYNDLIVMKTLVFHNSQLLLDDIYVPLTITRTNGNKEKKEKINNYPQRLSDEFHNILITDMAGMGKSTIMKKIFISAIYEKSGIPLFIELRRLNKEKKLIDEIQEQFNSLERDFDKQLLLELLAQGDFIVILDGFDEIPLSDKEIVTTDIQNFISKTSKNRFFLTSRPESALSCFGNFQEFKIEPLTRKEAFELLCKYDAQGKISSLLIEKLNEKDMENMDEFLTNPLLVSLLFTAFEYKQTVPVKKYLFYRQVYDALFETHDLTKGDSYIRDKKSKLSIDDFHRVLRHMGYNCFKQQKIEFSKDEILKLIVQSKNFCAGLSFNESDFLTDLIKTVPLFIQDGNYYRWAHKSLQEYFAAQFIYIDSKRKQSDILLNIYNHPQLEKFINVLDLYYDMDYKTFRNVIEFRLLEEYYEYSQKNYNEKYEVVSEEDIIERKQLMFNFIACHFIKHPKRSFSEDEIDDYLDYLDDLVPKPNGNFNRYYYSHIMLDCRVQLPILEVLYCKKNDSVRYAKLYRLNKNYKQIGMSYESTIFLDREFYELTDSKDNILNDAKYFKYITNSMIDDMCFVINHYVAIKKYEEIKASIEAEENDDLLQGF